MTTSNQIKSALWENKQEYPLTRESLKMLLEHRIPLIRLKDFATPEECEMLYAQSQLLNFNAYQDVSPKIEKVGITVFEYNNISKGDYFKGVEQATKLRDSITAASFNPLERIMAKFRECGANVRIASEPFYGSYYAGLIRKIEAWYSTSYRFCPIGTIGMGSLYNYCSTFLDFVLKIVSQQSWQNVYLRSPVATRR
ncbi:hypothetical protein ANSO36C_56350 [Nostoc cf. commune SO-36]|uniref:Uncharacterized protein n=1 Tax=Nostoc cf. commune SO-36 TaxID=449208 RepID=A0ABM7Z9D8_NOSCO|nr:hypothetical protein [Nostoc commune]BDI19833.1 hypothetical protein ANSO36C_56350 [Nostoc cf. commune SO-36]